ncbi:rho guanine nucleotide exchange factor TIAM1 isoform X6 [Myotis daubentonii]|uniref:rho guanine nucleotide exchange factor TIAM1 isoform X6 n=1 Tax=Myotis daubentonii TaxID=98922 RepID=UPI002872DCE3|nr:rho guanine nucleotide exchange factor TIAM1 isoform X6 [Myotis daubentonii]
MGNAESQSVEHAFYGEKRASLGRKHTSRSLRLSHKARRSRHAASGKAPPRRVEASARSSSTPSLPQALAENGLEPFAAEGALEGFGDPMWADRVEMGLRPVSYTDSSVAPSVDSSIVLAAASVQSMPGSEESPPYPAEVAPCPVEGGRRPRPCACPAPTFADAAGFKKKRSKSADIWREDSLEFSLSDLSQEHLSSHEEMLGSAEERDCEEARGADARAGPRPLSAGPRANSLGDLCAPNSRGVTAHGGPGGRCAGYCRDLALDTPRRSHRQAPLAEEAPYTYSACSAYNTLPCRRSHCLSEGATNAQLSLSGSLQGRRARTAQDVNAGEGSEFADSGIEGAATDPDLLSRRSNATHSSYSPPPGRAFVGSDSGSSSAGDAARQGVYENFRRELELSASRESPEDAGSAHSDERSSGAPSSPGRSDDALRAAARGTVRKAGALAVKNLLVHKKSRKVEPAARRRWKHYWASLKGCTLLFYESDGRSGIEPGSVPKHAVWAEGGVVQAVPEHPKKDYVFCLSNALGDAFLFQLYQEIEICPKATRSLQVEKSDAAGDSYGFSLSSVEEDSVRRLYVSSVRDTGLAAKKGLKVGDEILEINNRVAATLSPAALRDFLSQPSLGLLVRTRPELEGGALLLGSPPHRADGPTEPGQSPLAFLPSSPGPGLGGAQGSGAEPAPAEAEGLDPESSDDTDLSSKSTEQGAVSCRSPREMNPSAPSPCPQDPGGPQPATTRQLTDADKLRKVICELLETERTYVKDLSCLMERYLQPLQKETLLTQDELDVLFGNLTEMVEFQVEFLKTLEDGVRLVPDLEKLERVDQFKKVLFSLGGSFLYYADRFKLYSAFCASHTKVPKVLVKARTDAAFKAFLDAQNPRQQHSATLESYLIKPIQRVLKYPLLLRELFALTHVDSEEHYHLDVAIKTMNKVASHINEMQKIHEEFGAVFDQLIAEQTGEKKEVADLSMGDLLLHTMVTWPNPPASLGKWKKEPELAAFVFKTAVVLVYKDGSKQKRKLVGSHRLSIYEEWDPFRFRHMIPVEALQVRALASADADASTACEIVHVKSESEGRPERVFHLCCGSPKSRKDFLKAVHSVLRDKHRRQLLKAESLPSSQQYVPFGGKRLCALKGARPAMSRAVSAPSKSLGRRRRRLARNRFTVDADAVSACSPEREPPGAGDTDRWVEEQFDLARYEQQDDLKETDILSDDDAFCEAEVVRGAEDADAADLAGRLQAASLGPRDRGRGGPDGHASRMAQLRKQAALGGPGGGPEPAGQEVVWVRREDLAASRTLNTEI